MIFHNDALYRLTCVYGHAVSAVTCRIRAGNGNGSPKVLGKRNLRLAVFNGGGLRPGFTAVRISARIFRRHGITDPLHAASRICDGHMNNQTLFSYDILPEIRLLVFIGKRTDHRVCIV